MDKLTESVADIVGDMREHVQAVRAYPQDVDVTENDVEQWADRLEEAEEREAKEWNALRVKVAVHESRMPGNVPEVLQRGHARHGAGRR